MKKYLKHYLIILFFAYLNVTAQNININVSNFPKGQASLLQIEGEKKLNIDSALSQDGKFQFSLRNKLTGFYRLQLDHNHWLDFINDGKDVGITTDFNNILDRILCPYQVTYTVKNQQFLYKTTI